MNPTVDEIIEKLGLFLAEGWSIQLSMKKACGHLFSSMSADVRKHPRYLELLNQYTASRKLNMLYAKNKKGDLYQVRTSTYPHTKKI